MTPKMQKPVSKEPEFCAESGCIRKVLAPYIYCDEHQDRSSTPTSPKMQHTHIVEGDNGVICLECGEKLKPAPKLTPIDIGGDMDVIWLNGRVTTPAYAIKALADKVNEIIRRLENE